jgi:thiol:disulfide interchange protein DsbD
VKQTSFLILLFGMLGAGYVAPVQAQEATSQALSSPFIAGPPRPSASAEVVATEVRLPEDGVRAGSAFEAFVIVYVAEGWHINAHEPAEPYLIGTTLEVAPYADLAVQAAYYPDPLFRPFAFTADTLAVYEGAVAIILAMRASEVLPPGTHTLTGRLRVQACNDAVCLRPSTVEVRLPVEVMRP